MFEQNCSIWLKHGPNMHERDLHGQQTGTMLSSLKTAVSNVTVHMGKLFTLSPAQFWCQPASLGTYWE